MKLSSKYQEFCEVKVGSGDTALFWSNNWHGQIFKHTFPRLFSFALDHHISVRDMISMEDRSELFALPLSQQACQEFRELQTILQGIQLQPQVRDSWLTIWKDGVYSSKRYYQHCLRDQQARKIYAWIWKNRVMLRIKVFAWLMVSDRLNTRDMLRRRHWNVMDSIHCVLCPSDACKMHT